MKKEIYQPQYKACLPDTTKFMELMGILKPPSSPPCKVITKPFNMDSLAEQSRLLWTESHPEEVPSIRSKREKKHESKHLKKLLKIDLQNEDN